MLDAGEWAQKVQHPSSGLTKEYVATFATVPTRKQLEDLAAGCVVDGAYVQPKSVSMAAPAKRNKIRIVIGEGRKREVRIETSFSQHWALLSAVPTFLTGALHFGSHWGRELWLPPVSRDALPNLSLHLTRASFFQSMT